MATITLACMADCSTHGSCLNGTCICEAGYSGMDCSEEQELSVVMPRSAASVEWQFDWTARGSSNAALGSNGGFRLHMDSGKDAAFLVALIGCCLCMLVGTSSCLRMVSKWVHTSLGFGGVGHYDLSPTLVYGRGRSQSLLPSCLSRVMSPGGKLSVVIPDVRSALEIQSARMSSSTNCINIAHEPAIGGDQISPLPVPVAFRQQRDMRHRRVNSWGTPSDATGISRTASASSFILDSMEQQ